MRGTLAVAFLCLVLGAAGVLGAAFMFVSLSRGAYLTAAVVAGGAVFGFGMVSLLLRVATKAVAVRTHVAEGSVFRPDRKVDVSLMLATVALWAAMVLYAIGAPLGAVDVPLPYGDRKFSVWVAVAGVVIGLPTLRQILVKRGLSYLRLSPDGFELGTTTSSGAYAWDDLADVSDRPAARRRAASSGATYLTMASGRTRVVPSDWYTPGGHELRNLIRYYWQHPENRAELADGRAIARLNGVF